MNDEFCQFAPRLLVNPVALRPGDANHDALFVRVFQNSTGPPFTRQPIFLRSQQNAVTQLKRVVVVFRGRARMGKTLEEALRQAIVPE